MKKSGLTTLINIVFCACTSLVLLTGCDKPSSSSPATPVGLEKANVLVFSKTAGFRHDSIPAGVAAFEKLAAEKKFTVVASEDASLFTDASLRQFNAVVFLNTTGDVLTSDQQLAMERYIQAGGGFVGVHAATDTEWEGDWFWFRKLVGAVFLNHPNQPSNVQTASLDVTDHTHYSTKHLPKQFTLTDEWYNFRDIYQFINVVITVDETSYQGGEHGDHHPVSWFHEFDGGRSFYTAMGHTDATFADANFLEHLAGGLTYAVGLNHIGETSPRLDYSNVRPEDNRFVKKVLAEGLDEPVKLAFFPNGDALIALRPGRFVRVAKDTQALSEAGELTIGYDKYMEFGLVGVAVDPAFESNQRIYAAFNVIGENEAGEKTISQRLSRFIWRDGKVDAASEVTIIEYPVEFTCCHTAGDIEFGDNGEIYYSTGDNTNPHDQDGSAPLDFRPDYARNDGLRAPGNTMDLRGKVLRIIPKEEGGYTIPEGNLFTDPTEGRPEIYVMGARNPYSLTYDKRTKTLFYGDIGPDASKDTDEKGSRGYDEINRVTAPGNFGWPLVIGHNSPYVLFDYTKGVPGNKVDPLKPENHSPRNTGATQLPPAQPAFIAYPYATSELYPELGTGGRTALVADVYYHDDYPESTHRYPAYYDNKLFIAEFMRAWVKVVSFDDQGRIQKIEPFAPQISYALPIDSRFAPDGTLYVLEYGMAWFTGNPDARLSRIEYVGNGNRAPVADIRVGQAQVGLGATVELSAEKSKDLDGDSVTRRWVVRCADKSCADTDLGSDVHIQFSPEVAGRYEISLTVTDTHGLSATTTQAVQVGNAPADIQLSSTQNTSFFWSDTTTFDYALSISDAEDGKVEKITNDNPQVSFAYMPARELSAQGHQQVSIAEQAKELLDANNCMGCHNLTQKIVGPALVDVAQKYKDGLGALDYLVNKLRNGGAGVWGDMNMPAFSGLSDENLTILAKYVLSLADHQEPTVLPLSGKVSLDKHQKNTYSADEAYQLAGESYALSVKYVDQGANGLDPIAVSNTFHLLPPRLAFVPNVDHASISKSTSVDKLRGLDVMKFTSEDTAGFAFGEYDLTGVNSLKLGVLSIKESTPWQIQVFSGSPNGELLVEQVIEPTLNKYDRVAIALPKAINERHTLYVQVKATAKTSAEIRLVDVEFLQ